MNNDPFLLRHTNAAELYLIRHGDAIPGPDELIPGGLYDNLPLSKEGREQAQKLANRLKNTHFDAVYSSPLRRCMETAAPLLSFTNMTPIIVDDIKEIHTDNVDTPPTPIEGESLAELTRALQARQMEIVRIAGNTGHWDDVSANETSKDFRSRVVRGMDGIAQQHIGGRTVVFCHGGVINAYVAEVLGLQKEFFFPSANTSLTVVRANATTRVLFVLNDIAHLLT